MGDRDDPNGRPAAEGRYCVHDELPGDCRICSEVGDMMPEEAAPRAEGLDDFDSWEDMIENQHMIPDNEGGTP